MIQLIREWKGFPVGREFPEMGKGAARILVQRGFAEFINPADAEPDKPKSKPKPKPEPAVEPVEAKKDDKPATTNQLADDSGDATPKHRGRKKAARNSK